MKTRTLHAALFAAMLSSSPAHAGGTLLNATVNFLGNIIGPIVSEKIRSDDSQNPDYSAFDEQNAAAEQEFELKLAQSGLTPAGQAAAREQFTYSMDKPDFARQWAPRDTESQISE